MIQPDGALSHGVFVEPLTGMIVVGLVGIAALLMMRHRGKLWWGLAFLGMAAVVIGGLFVISAMVVTDREALSSRARELVEAVAVGDESAMGLLMAEHVRVETQNGRASCRERVYAQVEIQVVAVGI